MKSGRDLRVVPPVDASRVQIGEPENLPERFAQCIIFPANELESVRNSNSIYRSVILQN